MFGWRTCQTLESYRPALVRSCVELPLVFDRKGGKESTKLAWYTVKFELELRGASTLQFYKRYDYFMISLSLSIGLRFDCAWHSEFVVRIRSPPVVPKFFSQIVAFRSCSVSFLRLSVQRAVRARAQLTPGTARDDHNCHHQHITLIIVTSHLRSGIRCPHPAARLDLRSVGLRSLLGVRPTTSNF